MLIDPRGFVKKSFDSKSSLASAGFIVGMKKNIERCCSGKEELFIQPIYNSEWIFSYLRGLRTSVDWVPLKSWSSSDVHSFIMNEASMLGWGAWLRVWPWAKQIHQICRQQYCWMDLPGAGGWIKNPMSEAQGWIQPASGLTYHFVFFVGSLRCNTHWAVI